MKITILGLATLLIASVAPLHAAGNTDFKCTVTGTAQTQVILSPADGRIHTALLNNRRIFQEFQVSSTDYELVFSVGGDVGLFLIPKHTGAALPTITVMKFGNNSQTVIDTHARVIKISSDLDAGTAVNLFQHLAGEISGTIHFTGLFSAPVFKSAVVSMSGRGTDTGGGSSSALLKIKITTGAHFTPAP